MSEDLELSDRTRGVGSGLVLDMKQFAKVLTNQKQDRDTSGGFHA